MVELIFLKKLFQFTIELTACSLAWIGIITPTYIILKLQIYWLIPHLHLKSVKLINFISKTNSLWKSVAVDVNKKGN